MVHVAVKSNSTKFKTIYTQKYNYYECQNKSKRFDLNDVLQLVLELTMFSRSQLLYNLAGIYVGKIFLLLCSDQKFR